MTDGGRPSRASFIETHKSHVLTSFDSYVSPLSSFVAIAVLANAKYYSFNDSRKYLFRLQLLSHIDVNVLVIVLAEADRVEVDGDLLFGALSPVGPPADVVLAATELGSCPTAGAPPRAEGGSGAAESPRDVRQVGERGDEEDDDEDGLPVDGSLFRFGRFVFLDLNLILVKLFRICNI